MTISDAFPVDSVAAVPAASPARVKKKAGPHARMRARTASVPRVTAAAKVMWSDLRGSWWLPASVPTVARAWAQRWPDRDRVPGNSEPLYVAWAVWNLAIALPAAVLATAVAGLLAPALFVLSHPARAAFAALLAVIVYAAVVAA